MFFFAARRSRRSWKPNVQNKRFFSEFLQRYLSFRMTTSVIKKVKSLAGGIDQYLLCTKNEELLYPKAIQIKRNLRRMVRQRKRDEALAAQMGDGELAALGGEGAGTAADWLNSIPGLWQQDHGGSIGFPGRKFGSTFHPERWAERKQGKFGHAAYR